MDFYTSLPFGTNDRLGSGFPFADEAIVKFVLRSMSDHERSIVTSSSVDKAMVQALSASGGSSSQQKGAAHSISSTEGAPDIAHNAAAQKPKLPSVTAKDGPASKQPQLTIVPLSHEALRVRADLIWDHAIAVGLIHASFEKCMYPKAKPCLAT